MNRAVLATAAAVLAAAASCTSSPPDSSPAATVAAPRLADGVWDGPYMIVDADTALVADGTGAIAYTTAGETVEIFDADGRIRTWGRGPRLHVRETVDHTVEVSDGGAQLTISDQAGHTTRLTWDGATHSDGTISVHLDADPIVAPSADTPATPNLAVRYAHTLDRDLREVAWPARDYARSDLIAQAAGRYPIVVRFTDVDDDGYADDGQLEVTAELTGEAACLHAIGYGGAGGAVTATGC